MNTTWHRVAQNTLVKTTLGLVLALPLLAKAQVFLSSPEESYLVEHSQYYNQQEELVHPPAHSMSPMIPWSATAQCNDGTYSFSRSRRGTCSHHGGVSQW